ncbi:MAG: phosphoribosylglycinamide formyltransferase [Gammaproteobacteria bacterium]|nr:phosphoribosylglycinamide formyltransferase [Gammaproteobacteria bacterium]
MKLGILTSHGGSLIQSAIAAGVAIGVIICNNSKTVALQRARQLGVAHYHLSTRTHPQPKQLDRAIKNALLAHGCGFVLLAGYMKRLGDETLAEFKGRIINSHPSLLPKFGGTGCYGRRVHEAVIAAQERQTGITVHYVEGHYDSGPIIEQHVVPVLPDDTPHTLEERVKREEIDFLASVIRKLAGSE